MNTGEQEESITNTKRSMLALLTLLSATLACRLEDPAPGAVTLAGCYRVTFLGVMQSTERISTWRYRVEEQACAQSLSSWMLELPTCASVVDASPSSWEVVQPDPNSQLNGIRWQTSAAFERGDFSIVLSGKLVPGAVRAAAQGSNIATAAIAGPDCASSIVIVTATVPEETATATVIPSLSPTAVLPTITLPAVQAPAANSELILITENQQNLTFTCSDNPVEVSGNGNVITLLGSCSSITVRGNGNQVYWQSGSPVLTNTGNENLIRQQ